MTHYMAHKVGVRVKVSKFQSFKDGRPSLATDAPWDLLAIYFWFWFRFSAKSPALLSVAHTVSAECVTSLSAYFRFRPKVKLPLSVDL